MNVRFSKVAHLLIFLTLSTPGRILRADESELPRSRPPIETMTAAPLPAVYASERWAQDFPILFEAGTAFVAEMVALYPGKDLYFLARDGEYLYDLARLYLKDDPNRLKHIKILNGSRKAYAKTDDMRAYLMQEGVTPERLNADQIVMIDSGVIGSIHKKFSLLFPEVSAEKIHSHFLLSGNFSIPESRLFLTGYRPGRGYAPGNGQSSTAYELAVMREFENYPHYTGPYDQMEFSDGKWTASPSSVDLIEDRGKGHLERVTADKSVKAADIMRAIRHQAEQPAAQSRFESLVRSMTETLTAIRNSEESTPAQIEMAMEGLLPAQRSAFISDVLDAAQKKSFTVKNSSWIHFLKKLPHGVSLSPDMLVYVAGKIPEPAHSFDPPGLQVPKGIDPDIQSLSPSELGRALEMARTEKTQRVKMLILRMGQPDWYGDLSVVQEVIASAHFTDPDVQYLVGNYILSYPEIQQTLIDAYLTRLSAPPEFFFKRIVYAPHWYQSHSAAELLVKWSEHDLTTKFALRLLGPGFVGYWANRPEALIALNQIIKRSTRWHMSIVNDIFSNNPGWAHVLFKNEIKGGFDGLEKYRRRLLGTYCTNLLKHPGPL